MSKRSQFSLKQAKRYLNWLFFTAKGDSNAVAAQKYYGLTSFVISIIILAVSFHSLFNTILTFLANMFISAPAGTSLDRFGTSTVNYLSTFRRNGFLSGLLLITISFVILIGLSYGCCRHMQSRLTLWNYVNRLATLTNASLGLEGIGLILALIGHGFKLVVILDLIAILIYQIGTVDDLWQFHYPSRQFRIYLTVGLLCLYPICFLVVLYLLILASR